MLLATLYMTQVGDNPAEPSCTTHTADLSAYAGQTVRIVFVEEDDSGYFNALVDDVSVIVGSRDCNNNGVLDECELTTATDCNGNGVLDECEPDCNNNGVPDDCDLGTTVCFDSGELDPFDGANPVTFTLTAPPVAVGDVVLEPARRCPTLASPAVVDEYVDVLVNGAVPRAVRVPAERRLRRSVGRADGPGGGVQRAA